MIKSQVLQKAVVILIWLLCSRPEQRQVWKAKALHVKQK